ncbi:MlaD family protein [Gordonia jacobaea]|uniref:MlaD family protein n=1 Tax=Gordonia jacobaea TaxID=122202 RepID=UPI003D75CFD5
MRGKKALLTVVTLAAVAAVVAGSVVWVDKSRADAATSGFCAMFTDSIGLYTGNEITHMGVPIGKITTITPLDTAVRVDFTLDRGVAISAGTKAVTRSKSVLADRSVELVSAADSGAQLRSGKCIPIGNTMTPKSISEVTGSAADLLDQLAPMQSSRNIEGAIDAMSKEMAGVGPSVGRVLRTAASAAQAPEQSIGDLRSIIVNMAPLTSTALQQWGDIDSIVTKLPDSATLAAQMLWPGATDMVAGLIPLIDAVSDVQLNYGQYLWPASDLVAEGLHIAVSRVGVITKSLNSLPALASSARMVSQRGRGAALRVQAPRVRVPVARPSEVCGQVNRTAPRSCQVAADNAAVIVKMESLLALGGRQ